MALQLPPPPPAQFVQKSSRAKGGGTEGEARVGAQWADWFFKLQHVIFKALQDVTVKFVNLDFTGSDLTSIEVRRHNDLQEIQGGTAHGPTGGAEYYHLTYSRSRWPTVGTRVEVGETCVVDEENQLLVHGEFVVDGELLNDGEVVVL